MARPFSRTSYPAPAYETWAGFFRLCLERNTLIFVKTLVAFFAFVMCHNMLNAQPTPQSQAETFTKQTQSFSYFLNNAITYDQFFADSFKASVPKNQVDKLFADLQSAHGPVKSFTKVTSISAISGTVDVAYERATVTFTITFDPNPPHKVIGLFSTGVYQPEDNAKKISDAIRALPGNAGVLVQRLDAPEDPKISINAQAPLAIASGFKLWVLAEAASSVRARERSWDQVIPLGRASLPSGITQTWPKGTPATLYTLATLMISISDNTATDTLLAHLGREKVNNMVRSIGHSAPAKTLPILSTLELFSLKADRNAPIRTAYAKANYAKRIEILRQFSPGLSSETLNLVEFTGNPRSIDTIEWFASPQDILRSLNGLRLNGGREVLDILAVNKGIGTNDAARFAYVGYKGGSEVGVISMHLIIRNKKGAWYGISGIWNNQAAPVNETAFITLITRAALLVE